MPSHPSKDALEQYSLGRMTPSDAAALEEHLLLCESCRTQLAQFDLFRDALRSALQVASSFPSDRSLDVVHHTADGPVYSRSVKLKKGRWLAVHEGPNLQGGRTCKTLREANEYLFRSFVEMFPEHRCTAECGPVKHSANQARE
ncbi:MAG TPA: zf-HC2 domain-containing protein [Bryobacteraceae bacterium]|nr:zf-HC2 domain-containing protein [Bryobacteraceae bacterium]